MSVMNIVGLDLAGKEENPSGFCLLTEKGSDTKLLYNDPQILEEIESTKPECIAIDAPLWLQKIAGRLLPWRRCDELLIKKGFRPLSPALPTMEVLAMRAMRMAAALRQKGFKVIEVFPQATEKILKLSKEPRKNEHEYDALLCALTAKAYLEGNYEDLAGIILPR